MDYAGTTSLQDKQPHQAQQSPNLKTSSDKARERAAFLAQSDIFRHLAPTELHEVKRVTTLASYSPGRILYRPGEIGSALFLLASGSVQLYHLSTDGRKLITATLVTGSCFGEISLLGNEPNTSFAEVVEDSRICVMSKHDAEQLLAHKPSIALALLKNVGQRLAQLETQLVDNTFKSANARLATLLLQLVDETLMINGFSHEELAERLGVYRETVSVALRDFKESGAIELGRKHVKIINLLLLQEIAGHQVLN